MFPQLDMGRRVNLMAYSNILLFFLGSTIITPGYQAATVEELISKYAPAIWFHHEEAFFPSSVEFFLPEVRLVDPDGNLVAEDVTPEILPVGVEFEEYALSVKEPLDCPSCTNPAVLTGEPISESSVIYALYYQYEDDPAIIDISYNVFYPYNRGKDVCIGIPVDGECWVGDFVSFGNHVGDWEHITIRLWNEQPWSLYVSCHSFGSYYTFNETTARFDFERGDDFDRGSLQHAGNEVRTSSNGGRRLSEIVESKQLLQPEYSEHVETIDGMHPVVYSANGSHGHWGDAGSHVYLPLLQLTDETAEGLRWDTWTSGIVAIPGSVTDEYPEDVQWMNYRGRWGNLKDGCEIEFLTGECQLVSGPDAPKCCSEFQPPTIPPK